MPWPAPPTRRTRASRLQASTGPDGRFALTLPAGPQRYTPLFQRRQEYLQADNSREETDTALRPGEEVDLGDYRVVANGGE